MVVRRPFPAQRLDDRLADGVAKNYRQLNLSCNSVSQPPALENQFAVGSLRNRSFVQLALVDEGRKSVILDIAGYPPGEPVKNQIGAREALPKQYGDAPEYTLVVAGGDTDIKPVPAIELEARIRRAHSLIWAGGRRNPLVALLLLVSSARG